MEVRSRGLPTQQSCGGTQYTRRTLMYDTQFTSCCLIPDHTHKIFPLNYWNYFMKDSRFYVIIVVLMKLFVLWDIISLGVLYSTNVSELLAASIFKAIQQFSVKYWRVCTNKYFSYTSIPRFFEGYLFEWYLIKKVKGKVIPWQAQCGPEGG